MSWWRALFGREKAVIGMLHAPALPGSPGNDLAWGAVREWVLGDAAALAGGGVDGLMLENFGDTPFYPRRVPPHTVACMAVLARAVKERFGLPLGINVLRNDGMAALAVAGAAGADFIRVNVYTGARVADQGVLEGEAHRIQRYRRALSSGVRVFADVAVKHSAPLGPRPLEDEVRETLDRGRADAVVVSGAATGQETRLEDLRVARQAAAGAPVLAGSGATAATVAEILRWTDGVIVGTALKRDGLPQQPVDAARVRDFVRASGLRC